MTERFTTIATVPLQGDVDLEMTLANIPPDFTTKGMFFTRYIAALGAEWEELLPSLAEPAKHGRYHAFADYPLRDYVRVFERVARARFPGSTREAFRLLARGEIEVFSGSTLGKVAFSLLRDPAATLLRFPDLFKMVARASECTAKKLGERHVAVTFPRFHGASEQALGLVEGIVQTYDEEPRLDVTIDERRRIDFDVTW
ncbi:MAG: hypothetical protein JWO86_1713 [Myxococcaceae bacterium]|nr:hypothetical protein [Myxococcaceae bacterium]